MPKSPGTDEISATPGNKLTQRKRKHDNSGISLSIGERVEALKRYVGVDGDDDELPTTAPPPKRARFTEVTKWSPKNKHPAFYDQTPQQSVVQHPAPQHPATRYPAPRHPALQRPTNQHPALSTQQTRPLPQQTTSSAVQETSSVPVPDVQEQSRQLHRILLCPTDAYFDILSLANGTDMVALVEASWLNLSFLLHPRICPLPDAVKALSRVNDAYAWILKHPGLAQPYVSAPPTAPVNRYTPSPPIASSAASFTGVDTVRELQKLWDSPGTQPHVSNQQSGSGSTRVLDSPPPRTFGPRPSSHIYVNNGKPTIRPLVGWQFREHGGEVRVWYKGRWRPLIQNRPTFQGLRVDEDGWIMPIMDCTFNENQWSKVQGQAKLEFNSHPQSAEDQMP